MRCWWIRSDPCGLLCGNVSLMLLLFGEYAILHTVLVPWYGLVSLPVLIYTALTALAFTAHCRTQYSDPGAVPSSWKATGGATTCSRCATAKPKHVHHCSTCERCIVHMDHHCPWVNNCVGMLNQKYFLLFLLYTALCSIFCGAFLIARAVSCSKMDCHMTEFSMIIAICNAMEAFLFGMFTVIMLVEQIQAIFENVSYIDSLKNVKGNQRTRMEGLEQVFGEPFSYRWFLPVPITVRLLAEFKRFGELENGTAGLMSSAGDDEDESYELQKTA